MKRDTALRVQGGLITVALIVWATVYAWSIWYPIAVTSNGGLAALAGVILVFGSLIFAGLVCVLVMAIVDAFRNALRS